MTIEQTKGMCPWCRRTGPAGKISSHMHDAAVTEVAGCPGPPSGLAPGDWPDPAEVYAEDQRQQAEQEAAQPEIIGNGGGKDVSGDNSRPATGLAPVPDAGPPAEVAPTAVTSKEERKAVAEARTEEIKDKLLTHHTGMQDALLALADMIKYGDWKYLGYEEAHEYVAARFPFLAGYEAARSLPVAGRRALEVAMSGQGVGQREIARTLKVSPATVHADLKKAGCSAPEHENRRSEGKTPDTRPVAATSPAPAPTPSPAPGTVPDLAEEIPPGKLSPEVLRERARLTAARVARAMKVADHYPSTVEDRTHVAYLILDLRELLERACGKEAADHFLATGVLIEPQQPPQHDPGALSPPAPPTEPGSADDAMDPHSGMNSTGVTAI